MIVHTDNWAVKNVTKVNTPKVLVKPRGSELCAKEAQRIQ